MGSLPKAPLHILVVDDLEENLFLMSRLVTRMGHTIVTARSGEEALERFQDSAPDVVLLDIMMPGMDGVETAARIKQMQGRRWVPVIYVTAASRDTEYLRALEAGGDDFIPKPVSASMLQAKILSIERVLALQRENSAQQDALERYFHDAEEELRVASHLMQRLVQVSNLRDAAVKYRLTPASHLSGDLIAAARTPSGALHVLLADGTGHGLTASLGVMPVVQPFYAMTNKGFGIASILQEVNRKVREWLPSGRFVAATMIAVDSRSETLQVWNGGNPPVNVLGADGREIATVPSSNLPLGILGPAEFDSMPQQLRLEHGCEVIACSDGIVEAQGNAGSPFGHEKLMLTARAAKCGERFERINEALEEHLAGGAPHDDLSLVVIHCDPGIEDVELEVPSIAPAAGRSASWRFGIELGPHELQVMDVVPMLVGLVEQVTGAAAHRPNLFLIFAELYNNALDHGVLLLDSRMKAEPGDGLERYLRLRQKRLSCLDEGSVEISISLQSGTGGSRLIIRVCDSGDGFDWQSHLASADSTDPFGRGIALVRRLCSSVEYKGNGNEVVVHYKLAPASEAAAAQPLAA